MGLMPFNDFLLAVLGLAWTMFMAFLAYVVIDNMMKNSGAVTWWNGPLG